MTGRRCLPLSPRTSWPRYEVRGTRYEVRGVPRKSRVALAVRQVPRVVVLWGGRFRGPVPPKRFSVSTRPSRFRLLPFLYPVRRLVTLTPSARVVRGSRSESPSETTVWDVDGTPRCSGGATRHSSSLPSPGTRRSTGTQGNGVDERYTDGTESTDRGVWSPTAN